MRQIYELERSGSRVGAATTDFVQSDPYNVGDAEHCELCGGPIGMLRWDPPLRAELETWGAVFGDLAFGPGDSFLVSERFKDLWVRRGLIGLLGFEPVELLEVRHRGKWIEGGPPRYFRVWAKRSGAALDEVRSGLQWVSPPSPRCDACRGGGIKKGWERIVLEGDADENIFIARGLSGVLLVDGLFKQLVEDHGITNCRLMPAESAAHWF